MRSELITLVPAILAWWMSVSQSLEVAFLNVYLPVLLLIPEYFRLPIEGLPDPTFSQCAILPIGVVLCWRALVHRDWRFSFVDAAVVGYIAWETISNYRNVGTKDTMNLFFDLATMAILPYMAGKALIEPAGMRHRFARRFVWLLFVVSIVSIYEFRLGISPFRPLLARFFPYQDSQWFTQFRWGFGRIAGPYGDAILMGAILAIGYLLCRWLVHSRQWETQFKYVGEIPFTKAQILSAGLIAGMFMTLSRGPWLGTACGIVLASIGSSLNRWFGLKRAIVILAVGGILVYAGGRNYIDNGPEEGTPARLNSNLNEDEQSAAYRAELFDKYYDIAKEEPVWGWGRANWPQVPGMSSIDNNYLLIALNSGMVGVGLFVSMLVAAGIRLFWSGLAHDDLDPIERAFSFTLLGVLAAIAISTATVYLGSQLYPLLFLFLGWADACVIAQALLRKPKVKNAAAGFRPIRVVA